MEKINEAGAAPRSPTELVIDRSKWLRGKGGGDSMLLRPSDGKMCCLGFFGFACGYGETDLGLTPDPQSMGDRERWPDWLLRADDAAIVHNSSECTSLIIANDGPALPEAIRERDIAAIFARHGVTVRFVDSSEDRPSSLGAAPGDSK